MCNLFIIGNGFDLAHNLKTSYSQVIQDIKEEYIAKLSKTKLFKKAGRRRTEILPNNKILLKAEKNIAPFWYDIEAIYYELLTNNNDSPSELNEELDDIKDELIAYLKVEESKATEIKSLAYLLSQLYQQDPNIFVNFNYTNTASLYSHAITEEIKLHGDLSNLEENPVIFGYAATDEEIDDLLLEKDNEYIKYIKQYEYLGSKSRGKLNQVLENNNIINVFIMGHSCGLSDRHILKTILGHSNVKNIFNFHYNGILGHKLTLINLNRSTSQEIGFSKYRSFPECIRMPQHNDELTEEEIHAFMMSYTRINNQI